MHMQTVVSGLDASVPCEVQDVPIPSVVQRLRESGCIYDLQDFDGLSDKAAFELVQVLAGDDNLERTKQRLMAVIATLVVIEYEHALLSNKYT